MKSIRTFQHEARLIEFWPSMLPLRVLAEEWDCSTACISIWAKDLGLPSREGRKYRIRCTGNMICAGDIYMQNEADARGISVEALETRILRAVVEGRLVAAVLDDMDESRKAA